jgi:hypothetical protein
MFVTDAELLRALHLPEKAGRRALAALDAGIPNVPKFPQPDPLFGGRRYWPAVQAWFVAYYDVRLPDGGNQVTIQPMWEEDFDAAETNKAGRRGRARPRLAPAQG